MQKTYFLGKVDPKITLVILFEGKKNEKDSYVNNTLLEICAQLRGTRLFAQLRASWNIVKFYMKWRELMNWWLVSCGCSNSGQRHPLVVSDGLWEPNAVQNIEVKTCCIHSCNISSHPSCISHPFFKNPFTHLIFLYVMKSKCICSCWNNKELVQYTSIFGVINCIHIMNQLCST